MMSPGPMPVRTQSAMQVAASSFVPQSTAGANHTSSNATSPAAIKAEPTTSNSWATVGKSSGPKNIDIAPKKVAQRRFVTLNVDDERLDAPLPRADPGAEKRFLARTKESGKCKSASYASIILFRFVAHTNVTPGCNSYHLTGSCAAGEYCDYHHGERLSPGEVLVLKHKARSITCPGKHQCRDFSCVSGHHCKFGGKGCFADNCWFNDTHYMNLEPAKRVFEDGQEEWLASFLDKVRK